jgi:hypothetical protein
MLVLRCTRKLLDRVGPPVANPPQSTTVLGEWYAKPFAVAQRRFILLVNASTRIAVVMYARDVAHLPDHFPEALAPVLAQLGIPADDIVREVEASRTVVVATTDSRSLLGQLNDYALHIQFRLRAVPDADLAAMASWVNHMPVSPLGMQYPADVARGLFGLAPRRRALF